MSYRSAARLAWSPWVASVVLIALTFLLDLVTEDVSLPPEDRLDPGFAPRKFSSRQPVNKHGQTQRIHRGFIAVCHFVARRTLS